jgi:deazaflavin-dependent oxidoreductase (nitroreductase family)
MRAIIQRAPAHDQDVVGLVMLLPAQDGVLVPMPRWWTQINKRVFSPAELWRGTRPVLTHVGRSPGATYRTPLDVHPVDGGYVFVRVYGSQSDWVRNVLTHGRARLTIDGQDIELTAPQLICGQEAWRPSARVWRNLQAPPNRRVPANGSRLEATLAMTPGNPTSPSAPRSTATTTLIDRPSTWSQTRITVTPPEVSLGIAVLAVRRCAVIAPHGPAGQGPQCRRAWTGRG